MKAVMYHYVRPENEQLPYFQYLHVEDFVKQLDFFEREYGFVSKDNFFASLNTGIPTPGIILTFDDGFKDHYRFVLPELKRRNLWAFFFVCTGMYQTHKLLNVHRIHMLLGRFKGKEILEALKGMLTDDMLTDANRKEFTENVYTMQANNNEDSVTVKKILNYFIDYKHRDAILDALMKSFYGDEAKLEHEFYLTGEEIREMQNSGMLIGSHTVSHPVMSKLSVAEQQMQISQSFDWLGSMANGLPVKTFCYPYGGFFSFTNETEKALESFGVECSFNVESRDIAEHDLRSRKQALPRYDCNEFEFGQIRGFANRKGMQ